MEFPSLHCGDSAKSGEATMAQTPAPPSGDPVERIPFWQRVLDNPFLLLFIGVAMPTIIYLIWGIMELVQIPLSPP
jgi:hypothetical protein